MENRFVKLLLSSALFFESLTSPISDKQQQIPTNINKEYKNLQEFLSSPDFQECTSKSNQIKYVPDSVVYGKSYWQSFAETDSLKTGDCNDKSPYLWNLLNQKYPGFYLAMGYKDSINPNSAHLWIGNTEDKKLIIDPNFNLIKGEDTSCFVKIFNKDSLESKSYYEKKLSNYRKIVREFRRRTGVRLPVKVPR